jgi:signal transduction histidine kinase
LTGYFLSKINYKLDSLIDIRSGCLPITNDPFFSFGNILAGLITLSGKEKGMGLGIPLAHKIIRDHGGTLQVESRVGKGSVFRISLPIPGERA